jgi:hypothetical protein
VFFVEKTGSDFMDGMFMKKSAVYSIPSKPKLDHPKNEY